MPHSQKNRRPDLSAHELVGVAPGDSSPSEPYILGRKLSLKFIGEAHPELDRIEFQWSKESEMEYWQQGAPPEKHPMSWANKVPQALALFFLHHLTSEEKIGPAVFCNSNSGGLSISLANAINDRNGRLHELFIERLPKSLPRSRIKQIFSGKNIHGKQEGERCIFLRSENLPIDCIKVCWSVRGPTWIEDKTLLRELANRIRKTLGIELPPVLVAPVGEGSVPEPAAPTQDLVKHTPLPQTESIPPTTVTMMPTIEGIPIGVGAVHRSGQEKPVAEPHLAFGKPEAEPECPKKAERQTPAVSNLTIDFKHDIPPRPQIPPIPADLFEIHNPQGLAWEDNMPLLDLGEGEGVEDVWKLKDASEGVLILGSPGSGKTSGSGFLFAASFLVAGFGGLVLAAKSDEVRRWQKLCSRFGRAEDCIVVTPDSNHKLNVLAYETQRPGKRLSVTDDLIGFFRVLIAIVSKRPAAAGNDDFWTNATNQLMRELFDLFLLAGEPLTVDTLTRFVMKAPYAPTEAWPTVPFFGEVLLRGEQNQKTDEDQRIFARVKEYWTESYPAIAHQTRSGIELGFIAMANALSGRGIHELISTATTLTPEMILSGKIVILDLPLKECGQGGLLIQAAWKYLFQRAIERRADKGKTTARPVFLWEDEGHLFFSQHDIEFQPTARDCRAAHVVISQNLHNFYQLGHNLHAVQGVFATMNTHIFHCNGDLETNKWASERIGTFLKMQVNVSISSHPKQPKPAGHWLWDMWAQKGEKESSSSASTQQVRERLLEPESFSKLKKGGDGTCQAVVLWVAHKFKCNRGQPFRVATFEQDSNQ